MKNAEAIFLESKKHSSLYDVSPYKINQIPIMHLAKNARKKAGNMFANRQKLAKTSKQPKLSRYIFAA